MNNIDELELFDQNEKIQEELFNNYMQKKSISEELIVDEAKKFTIFKNTKQLLTKSRFYDLIIESNKIDSLNTCFNIIALLKCLESFFSKLDSGNKIEVF